MRIKRYEAPTIQEALMKVKKDLGPEAVILYTKTFRKGGVLGLFGKPVAEITAGVDLNLLDDVAKRKDVVATSTAPVLEKNEVPLVRNSINASSMASIRQLGSLESCQDQGEGFTAGIE